MAGAGGGEFSDNDRYRMNHRTRGQMIIINNKEFDDLEDREGTDEDGKNLKAAFEKLGFTVKEFMDRTADEMLQLMDDAARENHTDRDCFAVAVLSHGNDGILKGTDSKSIVIEDFIEPIKSCRTLVGKPKIFIFQACRGSKRDSGMKAVGGSTESRPPVQLIPAEADFLYAYSTVQGYVSRRNSARGSWFVHALHKMIKKHGVNLDFVSLLTRVNREVAYKLAAEKQVPSIVSMLTKDIYFTEKSK